MINERCIAFSKHDLQFVIFVNTFLVNLASCVIELLKKNWYLYFESGRKKLKKKLVEIYPYQRLS